MLAMVLPMKTSRGTSSRHVRTADLLPPPPLGKALAFAALAALAGAAAWGLIAYFAKVEIGYLAWGIGALIGFAIVKAGGHGTLLAVAGAALSVLSIGTGKHLAFRMLLDHEFTAQVAKIDPGVYEAQLQDATAWAALGEQPSDEQVKAFAEKHEFEFRDAASFRSEVGEQLTWIATEKPTLPQWRARLVADTAARVSFVEYLKDDFHPFDVLFVGLGLVTAFGLVNRYTTALQVAARQALREQHAAEQAEAEAGSAPRG